MQFSSTIVHSKQFALSPGAHARKKKKERVQQAVLSITDQQRRSASSSQSLSIAASILTSPPPPNPLLLSSKYSRTRIYTYFCPTETFCLFSRSISAINFPRLENFSRSSIMGESETRSNESWTRGFLVNKNRKGNNVNQ